MSKIERPSDNDLMTMARIPNSPQAKLTRARLRAWQAQQFAEQAAAKIAELEKSMPPAPSANDGMTYGRATVNRGGGVGLPRDRRVAPSDPAIGAVGRVEAYKRASAELERLREEHARCVATAESAASALPSLEGAVAEARAAEDARDAAKQGREAQLTDRFNYSHKR